MRRIQALKSKKVERPSHSPPMKGVVNGSEKLAQRLDALTAERKNLPTEAELQSRVDALNDFLLTHKFGPKPASSLKIDQDEVKNVVDQLRDEARLSALHREPSDKGAETSTSDRIYCSLCDNLASILCPACMDQEFCKYCFQ
ncbi:unnamed protein product [Taenia asiatica]|uniref:Uncharacterized protein n=1 Tax=Taenia asiatica TaxID=60517 RepID=A0A3P6PT21_TAEAS|nr:unnamed protein product [Taenia asiatica]